MWPRTGRGQKLNLSETRIDPEGKFHSLTVRNDLHPVNLTATACVQNPFVYYTAYKTKNVIKTLNAPAKSQPRTNPYKKFLWYSVVITTGSTTGNYHRTCPAVFWDITTGKYHRKVPHARYHRSTTGQYHRNTTGQYHRNTTGIPQVSTTELPQEYHRSVVFWDITTGQYHTLVTTGIPQVSTTGLPQELPQADTTGIPHSITTRIPHITTGIPHSNIPHGYHIALPCTVPHVATCSLVN